MDSRLERLIELLDRADNDTVGTSLRLPAGLRDAANLATEMGFGDSLTNIATSGLRDRLEAIAQRAVLDAHYDEFPEARPDLGEVAQAAAEVEGNPLASRPDLIRRAATEIGAVCDDPGPDEVLVYAAGLASAAA